MLAALALLVRAPAQELEQESSHPVLLSIAVTPVDASILPDRDVQFTATGTYSDGSTHNLTSSVTWSSSVPAAATINRVGAARALAVGQTTIEAALGAINGSATLNVVLAGGFVLTGSLNTALCCQTATMLNNGMVLIAGGWNYSNGDVASAELYDPATGTFTPTGSLNTGRFGHTATLLDNGMVLLAGGFSSSGISDSAELYNPATGTFSYTGSLNFPRWGHTATSLNNGMVLITGTWYSGGTAELYNPATGTFSYTTGNMNIAPVDQMATRLNNGMVLIAGGDGPLTASAELYNPATETFTPTGSLNTARARSTATLLNNGTVLIAGGYNDGGGAIANAELYDPATGTFTPTGSLNTARVLDTATLLNDGMVVIAGGNSCDGACGGALASAELYDPATETFTPYGSLNSARFTHTATLLYNGMVVITGGEDSSFYYLSSAELYEPVLCPPLDLESIAVTPATSTLSPGETQRFIATGKFRDGTTQQLASVTWSSSNPAVAQISNDASNPGVGLAIAPGTVKIEASAVWVRGWATLTVQKK
jgi:hypothetical protein